METLRLEVCHRSILLDQRPFIFITEDGDPVHETTTRGVVELVERHVRRRLRGRARDYGLAQLLGSLRQFNSTKSADDCSQFVVVEPSMVERLQVLEGPRHQVAWEEAVVQSVQARHPVDHLAIERWARLRGLWVGLTGKNQVLGGKVRLTTEGLVTDFEPNKLVARSLLDKPEAFRGPSLRVLVVDDPFVDQVTGDGAFLLRASAARDCSRLVTQRVRRTLDYSVNDAKRGQAYLHLGEDEVKLARHDTEILSVREDGDLLWIEKRERARIDTGAKLVHEKGFKATAIVVDRLPEHIERDWPSVDAVTNSSTIKSDALVYGLAQEVLWGEFQRGFIVHLPVRMTDVSPQTINNGLAVTSAVFRWAIERGFVNANPVQGVRRLRTPKGRETYLTAAEARALVSVAPERMRLFLVIALNTGMRRGEILELRWRAVDLTQGMLRVEDPKNHRPRTIRMNQTLRSEIARHALALGQRRRGPDRQVIAGLDGKRYTEWVLRTDLAKAVAACEEIPAHKRSKVTTHVLRHTAASTCSTPTTTWCTWGKQDPERPSCSLG